MLTLHLCAIESFLARNPGHRVYIYAKNTVDLHAKLAHHFRNDSSPEQSPDALSPAARGARANAEKASGNKDWGNAGRKGSGEGGGGDKVLRVVVRSIDFEEAFKGTPLQV
jgi:hypothetical protein